MKITADHLARGAYIYIRQSTVDQLAGGANMALPSVPVLSAGRM